jgi:hypothetical protein
VGVEAWTSAYLSAPWLASSADEGLVAIWSRLHEERAELLALIDKSGRTATGSMGQPTSHPHVQQLREVESEILKFSAVLGIGSLNAARLGVSIQQLAKAQETNAFRELVDRRKHREDTS